MSHGGLTMGLLMLCVATALATRMGSDPVAVGWLQISMAKIAEGQIWRLFTPVFLHFTLWHLIFNLLWMQDLGMTLERRIGTWRFAGVVALVALVSNGVQYATGGAGFGGMSGVVYGLFGYLWIRGKRDAAFAGLISPMTSGLLLIFLATGVFGLVGPTANAAHFSGLLTGMALGGLAALRNGWKRF
jgi:GlpG protein